ncbi:MAG TPA: PadR family transcriptional regulator [Actinomycetota bacterium]
MKSSTSPANPTLLAILGLLAIRPFTTYELERQFDRSLRRIWPRVRSKVYEGPKRLVELGYAKAATGKTGRRRHTTYSITAKGRRALAAWLAEPGAPPQLEYEQLVKVFLAEHGTKADVIANLRAAQTWAREDIEVHIETGRSFLDGTNPFQQRVAHVLITGRFISEFTLFVEHWATWALSLVRDWPDDPSEATLDRDALAANVELLERARATWR